MELTVGELVALGDAQAEVLPDGTGTDSLYSLPLGAPVIDSRDARPGDLFIALPGTRTDGTRFVGDAFSRGALAALTTGVPELTASQAAARAALMPDTPFAALVVPDTLRALQRIAAHWREKHDAVRVVGITGSVGKTTTREAVAAVLATALPTLTSLRSHNNEIGLPLTLLRLERQHRAAVLEMGMYARGEIAELAALARPHIGVVTMVAPVHLERLGSIEAIAAAKAELVEALPADGVAVLNGDDGRVRAMAKQTSARTLFFGLGADNDWRAIEIDDYGLRGLAFILVQGNRQARIETAVVGRHFIPALLAAAAVGDAMGLTFDGIAAALRTVRIGERQRLLDGPQGRLIIDDAWNASPPSMLAALDVLAGTARRHVAVLGGMLELGIASDEAHRIVGRRAAEVVDALVTVGDAGTLIAAAAREAGLDNHMILEVYDADGVPGALDRLWKPGDAVLVKGSRGLHLESVVQWMLRESATGTQALAQDSAND